MAKFKKTASKTSARKPSSAKRSARKSGPQAQAEHLSKTLSESAQHIWLAGVGAFGRAQAEGTKLFESLVKEGVNMEQTARKFAGGRADEARAAVESSVGQARVRAADTWDRLENVFEDRVQRALVKLGVPGRDDVAELNRRVETLTAELRRQNGASTKKRATKRTAKATKKTASKTAGRPAKKAAAKKTARKSPRARKTAK